MSDMKKLLSVLICLSLLLSLTSCGKLPRWGKPKFDYYGNGSVVSPDGEKYELVMDFDVFDGIRVTRGKAIGVCEPLRDDEEGAVVYEFDKNTGAILLDWGLESDYERHILSLMVLKGTETYNYQNYRDADIGGIAFMPWMEELKTDEFHDFSKYVRKHGFAGEDAKAIHNAIYSTDIIARNEYYTSEFAGYLIFYPEGNDSFCFLADVYDTYEHGFVAVTVEITDRRGHSEAIDGEYRYCANPIPDDIVEKLGVTTDIWG